MAHCSRIEAGVVVAVAVLALLLTGATAEVTKGTLAFRSGATGLQLQRLGRFCVGGNGGCAHFEFGVPVDGALVGLYSETWLSSDAASATCDSACMQQAALVYAPITSPDVLVQIPNMCISNPAKQPQCVVAAAFRRADLPAQAAAFSLQWTQADGSHFSRSDDGLYPLYSAAFFVWGLGLCAYVQTSSIFWQGGPTPKPIVVFIASMALMFVSLVCGMVHWTLFSNNGSGLPAFRSICAVVHILSDVTFLAFLMTAACSWSKNRLWAGRLISPHVQDIILKSTLAAVLIAMFSLKIVDMCISIAARAAGTAVLQPTLFALAAVALQVLTGLAIVAHSAAKLKHATAERWWFYCLFSSTAMLWVLLAPAVVSVQIFTPTWLSNIVTESVSIGTAMIVFAAVAYVMWPPRAGVIFDARSSGESATAPSTPITILVLPTTGAASGSSNT